MDAFDTHVLNLEGEVYDALLRAYNDAEAAIDFDALEAALEANDEAAIILALGIDEGLQGRLDHALGGTLAYILLGGFVIAMKAFATRHRTRVDTNAEAGRLRTEIKRNIVEPLARRASESMLITIKILRDAGFDSRSIAQAVREALHLSPEQARSAAYFRRAIQRASSDPAAIIDGDRIIVPSAVRKAIIRLHLENLNAAQRSTLAKIFRDGFTQEASATLIRRHARALADYRMTVIARQEAIRAANGGEYLAFRRGRANRSIPSDARRFWKTMGDERVRHTHSAIPGMNPNGVDVGESFTTPLGPVLYPPAEVNCRCRVVVKWPDSRERWRTLT